MPRKVILPPKEDFRKCFGCGKDNPAGLKLSFSWDGEKAEADFTPGELHQGWPGIMHGGLICCLLDEAMAYVSYFHGFKGLTARTQVRIYAPIPIGEPLHVTAKVVRLTRKLLETGALVTRQDGSRGAEAQAVIFLTEKTGAAKNPTHQEACGPLTEDNDPPKAVLWDMAQTLHLRESGALAEMLLEDLARGLRLGTRGVKHGPFVVLMTAEMPSVLVEVGFLSNPNTERRMQGEAHRQHIAAILAQGIGRFADRYQRRLGMQPSRPGRS